MTYLAQIDIHQITAAIQVRKTTDVGVQRMMRSIKERGYLERYPIAVTPTADGYKLLDGNHRVEAVRRLEIGIVPAQVYENLTPNEEYRVAFESNASRDEGVPQDWTDNAEFVWSLAGLGKTQAEIAEIMRWSRDLVARYASLRTIAREPWQIVCVTTKDAAVTKDESGDVTVNVTSVTVFTEGLLRAITGLTAEQQLSLVKSLAAGKTDKAQFKTQAEKLKTRNGWLAEAARRLKDLPQEYLDRANEEIEKGTYDKDAAPSAKFDKLIQQLLDEHAQRSNYRLMVAEVADLIEQLEPGSIDAIVTDPPYGQDALDLYEDLAKLAAHALRSGGSLIVMTGHSYLPEIMAKMGPHIRYHWMGAYLTPGGQSAHLWQRQVNTFWKPLLWYVNGDYTGKWVGDVVRSDMNDNDKRFHKWGQSESGMADLLDKFTNPGETVLDPFLGGGTTGVVAAKLGRKFIGSDIDPSHVETARKRIEEATNG